MKSNVFKFILVIVIVGLFFSGYWFNQSKQFNAEKILNKSIFNNRSFRGHVTVVSALEDKIKAYLLEDHSVALVGISFSFKRAGRAYEKKAGTVLLMKNSLLDGAGDFDRVSLRNYMKDNGIKLNIGATDDVLFFDLSFVKSAEGAARILLKNILYAPKILESNLELVSNQLNVAKKQSEQSPQYQLQKLVNETYFAHHPYGNDDIPELDILKKIKRNDILSYMKEHLTKDMLSIGVSGDMDKAETEAFLSDVFALLKDKSDVSELKSLVGDNQLSIVKKEMPTSAQSFGLWIGNGVQRLDEDFYPLFIADYIFGGAGLNSRLNRRIREKEGLTYGIFSYLSNRDAVDLWQISYSATPDNVLRIYDAVKDEYENFYNYGVSDEEVQVAKKNMIDGFNLRFNSTGSMALQLRLMYEQGLGSDFLEKRQGLVSAVTVDDVNQAIKRRLAPKFEELKYFQIEGK